MRTQFLNEVMHHQAASLFDALCEGGARIALGEDGCYEPLNEWREDWDLSDDKAADLYARIEEDYGLGKPLCATGLSRILWESERALVH